MINNLADKIKKLEEHVNSNVELELSEHNIDETELNLTFQNPYLSNKFPCERCDFEAKLNSGLQLHVKSKHNNNEIIIEETRSPNDQEIFAVNETDVDIQITCDQCQFTCEKDEEL